MLEEYEEEIEDWYNGPQDTSLQQFLCVEKVLDRNNQACLSEPFDASNKKNERRKADSSRSTEQRKIEDEL